MEFLAARCGEFDKPIDNKKNL